MTAQEIVNGAGAPISDTVFERIVEPSFSGLDKQIVTFDPNPSGTTGNATVQLSFTQNGGLPAFDAQVSDSFAGGSNYTLLSVSINGVSFGPGNLPAGVSFSTTRRFERQFRSTGRRRADSGALSGRPCPTRPSSPAATRH